MAPLLNTKCYSGNKLDRSTWSIKSIPGGSCCLNRMGPADVSMERMQTISRVRDGATVCTPLNWLGQPED